MGNSVAVEGDAQAIEGTVPFKGAESGKWTAGPITYSSYEKLKVGGSKVIYQAKCIFTFQGTNSAGATIPGAETVTLEAKSTKLQGAQFKVLVNGDNAEGEGKYGNKLQVQATNKLSTV